MENYVNLDAVNLDALCLVYLSTYVGHFPQFGGVADNTKETTKTMGVSLRSSSSDEGPSRVWMALLEQHSPSFHVFHNLSRFIDAISPTDPTTGLPLQGNPMATADANQNYVTIIRHSFLFLARSLASLISILLSFRALFTPSIHPNLCLSLALLPSTFAFITFFSSRSCKTDFWWIFFLSFRLKSRHRFIAFATVLGCKLHSSAPELNYRTLYKPKHFFKCGNFIEFFLLIYFFNKSKIYIVA